MKIGILTYHRAHNYGALLQAYALKTYLEKMGHTSIIIDYWPEYHDQDYKYIPYFKSRSLLGKIKALILLAIGFKRIVKRTNGYKSFMKTQLNLPEKPSYRVQADMDSLELDVAVYGSDQIWRRTIYPGYTGFSDVFYGAGLPKVKNKITYAASMGVIEVDQEDKKYLKNILKNFNRIAVREEDLKGLVDEVLETDVTMVLDPVFLLTKEEWISVNNSKLSKVKNKYILFYQLTPSEEAIDFVNRLRDFHGYDVIEIRGRVEPLLSGNRYFQTASPFDFLSLIQNAEIVVSTSFHGVAFSLVFEKQFYALGMKNNSGRVRTLLSKMDISNRLLDNTRDVNFNEQIDFEKVELKKRLLIENSKKYLKSTLDCIHQ